MNQITGPLYKTRAGLYFEPGDFYLDPVRVVQRGVVSHAHFDHFNKGIRELYATPVTCGLIELRVPGFRGALHAHAYRKPFMVNGVSVTFFPAGHILGSALVLLEHEGKRYLYTGDFKVAPDRTCEGFEAAQADVLICESTYAVPGVAHPDEKALIRVLDTYRDANVIIGAYVLGKAQRLTELLCRAFPGRTVMVHPEIVPYHSFYEHHDIELGGWSYYDTSEFRQRRDIFLIVPPRMLTTFQRQGVYHTLLASSYSGHGSRSPLLRLSDHADWNGFEHLLAAVRPESVVTTHGDGTALRSLSEDAVFFNL